MAEESDKRAKMISKNPLEVAIFFNYVENPIFNKRAPRRNLLGLFFERNNQTERE